MCGIVGVAGSVKAQEIVLNGLARLEYRGYDSAGVAVAGDENGIAVSKEVGKLESLRSLCPRRALPLATPAGRPMGCRAR